MRADLMRASSFVRASRMLCFCCTRPRKNTNKAARDTTVSCTLPYYLSSEKPDENAKQPGVSGRVRNSGSTIYRNGSVTHLPDIVRSTVTHFVQDLGIFFYTRGHRATLSYGTAYRSTAVLLRGSILNRTYGTDKNLYKSLYLLTIFGPIYYGPL